MNCPKDKFGMYDPIAMTQEDGSYYPDRQLFMVDKKLFTKKEAWDVAYEWNIEGKRYLLWRLNEDVNDSVFGFLPNHENYWYFEFELIR